MLLVTQESIKDILNKHTRGSAKKQTPTKPNPRMTVVDNSFDKKLSDPNYLQIYKQMLKTYYSDWGPTSAAGPAKGQLKILTEGLERVKRDIDRRLATLEELAQAQQATPCKTSRAGTCPRIRKGATPGRRIRQSPAAAVGLSVSGAVRDAQNLSRIFADDEMLSVTEKEMLAYALLHSSTQQSRREDVSLGDMTCRTPNGSKLGGVAAGNMSAGMTPGSVLNNARLDSIKEEEDVGSQEERGRFVRVGYMQRPRSSLAMLEHHDEAEVGEDGEEGGVDPRLDPGVNGSVSAVLMRTPGIGGQESVEERKVYGCILENMGEGQKGEMELVTPVKVQTHDPNSLCRSSAKKRSTLFCLQSSPIEPKLASPDNVDLSFASGLIRQIESQENARPRRHPVHTSSNNSSMSRPGGIPTPRSTKEDAHPTRARLPSDGLFPEESLLMKPVTVASSSVRGKTARTEDTERKQRESARGSGKKLAAASFCCGAFRCGGDVGN